VSIKSTVINHGLDGNELEAQNWLADYLKGINLKVEMFEPEYSRLEKYPAYSPGHSYKNRPNVVGILKGKGGGKSLILNGHIDTMEPQNLEKWKYDPYSATIENDILYGVGSCDMKAGLCAMVMAVEAIQSSGIKLKGDVIIESVVDEEGGGNGTLDLVDRGYRADGAIVAEATKLEVQPASRGVLLLEIRVSGKATHACLKWGGVNAIEKGIMILSALRELERVWLATRIHPLLPRPTITIGQINGGVAGSVVPGECTLKLDIKYLPSQYDLDGNYYSITGEMIKKEITNKIMDVCKSDDWLRDNPPELKWYQHCMPHEISSDHDLVKTVVSCGEKILGNSKISGFPAGCDARHLQLAGIPTIVFGPGNLQFAHSINEHVSISEYLNCVKVFALIVMQWCGY
jgi:acetylornithine deacetylase